jgi:hypothetical protein
MGIDRAIALSIERGLAMANFRIAQHMILVLAIVPFGRIVEWVRYRTGAVRDEFQWKHRTFCGRLDSG